MSAIESLIQYDEIVENEGRDAANAAQEKAEKEGKIIIKDSIADIFLQHLCLHFQQFRHIVAK
jgi:isocitrate dehydrogenase